MNTSKNVFASSNIASIYNYDRRTLGKIALLCLKEQLLTPELKKHFCSPNWAIRLFNELTLIGESKWLFAEDHKKEHPLRKSDLTAVISASGIHGNPKGNIRCRWPIRSYQEEDSAVGGLNWLKELSVANSDNFGIARDLTSSLVKLSEHIHSAGGKLIIEQISILLSKDPSENTKCHTPAIHSDEYYGTREAAVTSIFEAGWTESRGTVFFPTITSKQLGKDVIMDPTVFTELFPNAEQLTIMNGEVAIYDGCRGRDGQKDLTKGIPHISGDEPGKSARLLILMRHAMPPP